MLAWLAICATAHAAPSTLVLSPGDMLAQTHSHAIVMNIVSTYQQLSGLLTYDRQAGTCHIDATFVVRSLTAPNAMLRAQSMSKNFLDPQDFPRTHYVGDCQGNRIVGNLTLRGQTHPFDMQFTYTGSAAQPAAVHAEGVLNRYAWGVSGLHMTVGRNIRITNDISLNGTPPVPMPHQP